MRISTAQAETTAIKSSLNQANRTFALIKLAAVTLVACLMAQGASAADPVVGDAQAGAKLVTACQACHGSDGRGLAPNYPNIGGQNEKYLFRQLQMIQDGSREAVLMAGQLNGCLLYTSPSPRDRG